jgi:hypothetical protein
MKLIGDKSVFAIEYEVVLERPMLLANSCLWIQGKFLGNYEDSGLLFTVWNVLISLIAKNGNFFEKEFVGKRPDEVLLLMIPNLFQPEKDLFSEERQRLIKYDKYICSFAENYDPFISRVYAIDGWYYFVWKLHAESLLETEFSWVSQYSLDIQSGKVSIQDMRHVCIALLDLFPEWQKGKQ